MTSIEVAQVVRDRRADSSRTVDAEPRQPRAEIAQRLGEFLLARNASREIELAADFRPRRRTA